MRLALDHRFLIRDYDDLITALKQRRRELKLSQEALCYRAGLHDGYVNKLEAWKSKTGRRLGQVSLPVMLASLGLSIVLVDEEGRAIPRPSAEDPQKARRAA